MDIRTLISFIRRRGWLMVVGAVVAGVSAFVVTSGMQSVYEAKASILVVNSVAPAVQPPEGQAPPEAPPPVEVNDLEISEAMINTYAELVARPVILQEVANRVGGARSAEEIEERISIANEPIESQILRIAVRDSDPNLAASIANMTAQVFIEENAQALGRPGTVSIAQEALVPSTPVEPRVRLYTLVAAVAGLVVAAVFARGVDLLDDTVKSPDDIENSLAATTLGVIGRVNSKAKGRIGDITDREGLAPLLGDFGELRNRVYLLRGDRELKTVVVLSQQENEGRTTTAAGLAEVLAHAGEKVILVDTNIRDPRLHEIYNVSNSVGLTSLLISERSALSSLLIPTSVKNLRLLPAGPILLSPSELFVSRRVLRFLTRLRQEGDIVIIDAPPLDTANDALVLASMADRALVTVAAGQSRINDVRRTISKLREVNANLMGVLLYKANLPQGSPNGRVRRVESNHSPSLDSAYSPGEPYRRD